MTASATIDPEEDEEDDDDEPINLVAPKGKSKGKSVPASAFALLGDEDEDDVEEEEPEEEDEQSDEEDQDWGLRVAEVMSVDPHPKADKLKVCRVDGGPAGIVTVVTNAMEVQEDMLVVLAVGVVDFLLLSNYYFSCTFLLNYTRSLLDYKCIFDVVL